MNLAGASIWVLYFLLKSQVRIFLLGLTRTFENLVAGHGRLYRPILSECNIKKLYNRLYLLKWI
jgi:hypothetical protein